MQQTLERDGPVFEVWLPVPSTIWDSSMFSLAGLKPILYVTSGSWNASDVQRYILNITSFLIVGARCSPWQWRTWKAGIMLLGLFGHAQLSCLGIRIALQVWSFPSRNRQGWSTRSCRKLAGGSDQICIK